MKISYQWLNDFVALNVPVEKLAHKLTMAGLEVEKIEKVGPDHVLELEITPNRPDCLSMLGIAREVSAILNRSLKYPKLRKWRPSSQNADVSIIDSEGCSRYIGVVIKDVNIKPAPEDMQQKLKVLGMRPVNNIVDVTNFCLMELGQPLHAFDYDKLQGGKIVVRRAKKNEKIVTLDGEERELNSSILVIADAKRPVAIAGIMGGLDTEVTIKTKNILLESACFDPTLIRRGARKLGLSSESSYRFERGIDIDGVERGALRACSLIKDTAGGEISGKSDTNKRKTAAHKTVIIGQNNINALLGSSLSIKRCKTILKKLEFKVSAKNQGTLSVAPPSTRTDIKIEEDVIEEIARIVGYDNLPLSLPLISISNIIQDGQALLKKKIRQLMRTQGFSEAVSYSMLSYDRLKKTGLEGLKAIDILNPLSRDQEAMRPSLLPNLLAVVQSNLNRGQQDIKLFEIGKRYDSSGEKEILAIIMRANRYDDWRLSSNQQANFYDLKGALSGVLEGCGILECRYTQADISIFEKGLAADIKHGKQQIGILGRINHKILRDWDIKKEDIYYAEIYLEALYQQKFQKRFSPISEYPSIVRDVSIAVNKDIPFQKFYDIAKKEGANLLYDIKFLEEYLGDNIPSGNRGLFFSLIYQSKKRTLTEEEVNNVHSKICLAYTKDLGAILR